MGESSEAAKHCGWVDVVFHLVANSEVRAGAHLAEHDNVAKDVSSGKKNPVFDRFDQELLNVIRNHHPETLAKAIELTRLELADCDEDVMDHVLRLESQGKILLEKPQVAFPPSLFGYFKSSWALWFWCVFGLAIVTTGLVFVVPENVFPMVYARYVFGSVLVLFLPGYCLIKALFAARDIDNIERFVLSIGSSLALMLLAGLLLNYTPWGIRTAPTTLSLLALTLIFASAAAFRDYGIQSKMVDV